MAGLASPPVRHTTLVGRTNCHTLGRRSMEVSLEDPCFLLDPGGQMWGPPKPRLHHASCSQMSYQGYIPPQWPFLPGCPVAAPTTDLGLCSSTVILGGESQTTNTQWLSPFSDECSGIKVAGGGAHHLQQARHLSDPRGYYPWSQKQGHRDTTKGFYCPTHHCWCQTQSPAPQKPRG